MSPARRPGDEREPRGLIHRLDAGDYRAVVRNGVPAIERVDTLGAVHAVAVPVSPELLDELRTWWSNPVQFKIEDGELVFRTVS